MSVDDKRDIVAETHELEISTDPVHQLENVEGGKTGADWDLLLQDAVEAENEEKQMGWKQALQLYPSAIFWSFAISLCIVMEGYDTQLMGNVIGLPVFREKYGRYSGEGKGNYQLTPAWQTGIGQAATCGNILGIFMAAWFQNRYGYRRTIQIGLIWLSCAIFVVFFSNNVQTLLVGELLCGFPWGAFSSSAVAYASEVTPVALRGYLTTYVNLCWVIGQFVAAGILVRVDTMTTKWAYRIPFAVQWAWPVPLFILATSAPESPWWLVRAGRLRDAEYAVRRLSRKGQAVEAEKTVAMMVRTNQHERANQPGTSFLDCFKGSDLRRTEIACMAWSAQVLCGSPLGGQGTYFFEQAGLATADAFKFNLGKAGIGFIGTVASWYTLTKIGRRKVYLAGEIALGVILLVIGGLAIPSKHGNPSAKWGQAAMALLFSFTYDFTIGPVCYCIVGEVSSTRLRVKTIGLARNFYNVVGIVFGIINTWMMNPTAWNLKGEAGFFWFCTCLCMITWTYFRLPECKGRTYRELDVLFERKVPARRFRETQVDMTGTDRIL